MRKLLLYLLGWLDDVFNLILVLLLFVFCLVAVALYLQNLFPQQIWTTILVHFVFLLFCFLSIFAGITFIRTRKLPIFIIPTQGKFALVFGVIFTIVSFYITVNELFEIFSLFQYLR